MLDNTPNQRTKFRTKNWVEIDDESRGTYDINSQIRFKTSMLRSSLCDYSDAYILVKGGITAANTVADEAAANNTNKKAIFKNCAPFSSCISRTNNTQIDDGQYIDVEMPVYNLVEYSDDYSKTSGILFQYGRDFPAVDNNGAAIDFTEANVTDSFNLKVKSTCQIGNNGTKNVEIMMPLKYLINFWRILEMPLINCEITLDLNWSGNQVLVATNEANQGATFSITDTKFYVPVLTLSNQDNAKLLEKLQPGFKRTINWNKHQAKASAERVNQYLDYLIDPSFQGINKLFVLPFENEAQRQVPNDIIFQLKK